MLKSPPDLAIYPVNRPLPSKVCISDSLNLTGHSRKTRRRVLHHESVEIRPVLRIGEAEGKCQSCKMQPCSATRAAAKDRSSNLQVNLQWGIQNVIIVLVSFVVPKEIAHAIPCVRVVVSVDKRKSTSALCQSEEMARHSQRRSLALEQEKGGSKNVPRTCMSCCCADWAGASPGTT